MRLRIKFRKFGAVRFIGHLDVMRFFQKAIRRAQIDVAYTAGFSPHQIMSFAAPLGVGITSNGEYMDIEVNSMISCEDIKERLNKASVPGIEITGVSALPQNAENAMASVAAAAYTVRFRKGREPEFDLFSALPAFLAQETIPFTKETKRGIREIDLRPGIYKMILLEEDSGVKVGLEADEPFKSPSVYMLVDASSAGNVKPSQILEALFAQNGQTMQGNALMVNREELFFNTGTRDKPCFVPLDTINESTLKEGDMLWTEN